MTTMLSKAELASIEERLLSERAVLTSDSAQSEQSRRPVTLDQPAVGRLSRMDALQDQAMAQATEDRRRQRRAQIDTALDRLHEGAFGECVACGEEIARGRLDLDPAVPTCLACASARG